MKELPITMADILLFATVASISFTLVAGVGKWVMGYLTLKFGAKPAETSMEKSARIMADQSMQCRFDHEGINKLIVAQNRNIEELLKQNGEQIRALTDANHNAQLRHQIVLSELKEVKSMIHATRKAD